MSQTLGECIVKIGVEGLTQVSNALNELQKGLKEAGHNAFLFKASWAGLVAGSLFALKHMAQVSGDFGLQMSLLETRTGMATDTFQKFAYAGEKAGIATNETMQTLSSLQKQMDAFTIKGEGPEWINELMAVTGGDLDRVRDTVYLFQKLQQYAMMPEDQVNKMRKRLVLSSFGLSDQMIAAMMKGAFNKRDMWSARTLNRQNTADLSEMGGEWNKLVANLKNLVYKFSAVILSPSVTLLIKALNWFVDKFHDAIEWFEAVVNKIGDFIVNPKKALGDTLKDLAGVFDPTKSFGQNILEFFKGQFGIDNNQGGQLTDDQVKAMAQFATSQGISKVTTNPAAPVTNNRNVSNANNSKQVTINQTNNFTNAKDNPDKVRAATESGVRRGVNQFQNQVNQAGSATGYAATGN